MGDTSTDAGRGGGEAVASGERAKSPPARSVGSAARPFGDSGAAPWCLPKFPGKLSRGAENEWAFAAGAS